MTQERFYRDDEPLTPEDQARVDIAWEIHKAAQPCAIPPEGWSCSRTACHDGPCAATPKSSEGDGGCSLCGHHAPPGDHLLSCTTPIKSSEPHDELEHGKAELRRLIESIWLTEYRNEAPDWQPLPDLVGMITQIDNMYAGVRSQRDELRYAAATPIPSSEGELLDEAVAVLRWVRANYASGSTAEINNRIDAFLAKAGKAQS